MAKVEPMVMRVYGPEITREAAEEMEWVKLGNGRDKSVTVCCNSEQPSAMTPSSETFRAIGAYEDMPKGIERLVDLLMTPLSNSFLVMVHRELGERLGVQEKPKKDEPVDAEKAWQEIMNIGRGMR